MPRAERLEISSLLGATVILPITLQGLIQINLKCQTSRKFDNESVPVKGQAKGVTKKRCRR